MSHPMQHMQWAVMGLVSIEDSQEREPGVAQECLEILVLWSGRGRGPKIYPTAPKYGTSLTGTKPFIENINRGVRSKSTRHSACTIPQKPTGICTPTQTFVNPPFGADLTRTSGGVWLKSPALHGKA